MDDPCVRCDNLPDCANDGKLCKDGKLWEEAAKIIASKNKGVFVTGGLFRFCSVCGKHLPYHTWVEVRCTLDNEDTTKPYCYGCFISSMDTYLKVQFDRKASEKAKQLAYATADEYYDGKPHYRSYGNHPW